MLALAVKIAESSPNKRHKHAALFTVGPRILQIGQNTEFAVLADSHVSRHAEEHAMRDHLDTVGILYVARLTPGGDVGFSKPCYEKCLPFLLNRTRVKRVYYTMNDKLHGYIDLNKERSKCLPTGK